MKPRGTVGIVVIDGILNNHSTRYVRDFIKKHAWVRGIISLNKETFEGYGARAKTSILFLERKSEPDAGTQRPVFMAIARNTGLAPNGALIAGNVLPDILLDYKEFKRGEDLFERHSSSWISTLDDRLDAEFYARGDLSSKADLGAIRQNVSEIQDKIAAANMKLEQSENLLANLVSETVKLGDLLDETRNKEKIDPEKIYKLLGVRWWGEEAFIREQKRGREIKASTLFRVAKGNIIYNRLFAFRGSFAIVPEEQDGCYVSGEFRNRFNQSLFNELTISRPISNDDLVAVVNILDTADIIRTEQHKLLLLGKELREGVFGMLPLPTKPSAVLPKIEAEIVSRLRTLYTTRCDVIPSGSEVSDA